MIGLNALWGDEQIPVTRMYNRDGDEVTHIEGAFVFVAGPLRSGSWLCDLVDDHPELRPQ